MAIRISIEDSQSFHFGEYYWVYFVQDYIHFAGMNFWWVFNYKGLNPIPPISVHQSWSYHLTQSHLTYWIVRTQSWTWELTPSLLWYSYQLPEIECFLATDWYVVDYDAGEERVGWRVHHVILYQRANPQRFHHGICNNLMVIAREAVLKPNNDCDTVYLY